MGVHLDIEIDGPVPDGLDAAAIELLARTAVELVGVDSGDADLGVSFVDADRMRALNATHRGVDAPTDVLSFPIDLLEDVGEGVPRQLGDIVICIETVAALRASGDSMAEADRDLASAIRRCIVHGALHLTGFDHERGKEDAERMFSLEQQVLDACHAAREASR